MAVAGLEKIYRPGYHYKKAGVIAGELVPARHRQLNLFVPLDDKHLRLMQSIDKLNAKYGYDLLKTGGQDPARTWKMRQVKLSPSYTTRLEDVIRVKVWTRSKVLENPFKAFAETILALRKNFLPAIVLLNVGTPTWKGVDNEIVKSIVATFANHDLSPGIVCATFKNGEMVAFMQLNDEVDYKRDMETSMQFEHYEVAYFVEKYWKRRKTKERK